MNVVEPHQVTAEQVSVRGITQATQRSIALAHKIARTLSQSNQLGQSNQAAVNTYVPDQDRDTSESSAAGAVSGTQSLQLDKYQWQHCVQQARVACVRVGSGRSCSPAPAMSPACSCTEADDSQAPQLTGPQQVSMLHAHCTCMSCIRAQAPPEASVHVSCQLLGPVSINSMPIPGRRLAGHLMMQQGE